MKKDDIKILHVLMDIGIEQTNQIYFRDPKAKDYKKMEKKRKRGIEIFENGRDIINSIKVEIENLKHSHELRDIVDASVMHSIAKKYQVDAYIKHYKQIPKP